MSALLDSAHLTSRTNPDLFGHREAVRELVTALESGRMPHAWILHGPPGIGKATLAFRLARHVLAGTKTSDLSLPSDHPVFSQVGSGGHPDLIVVEHNSSIDPAHLESDSAERQKPRKTIPVKEVRQIRQFFSMTAGMTGGARVAIVNDAHLLNREGQNALLKPLEEPPTGGLILLVAPSLTQLLPTVRSRCRKLAMAPLSPVDTADLIRCQRQQIGAEDIEALVALSEGRPGRALQLADSGALEDIASFMELARGFPRLDWPAVHAFAGKLAGRGREAAQAATLDFIVQFLGTLVRRRARGETETDFGWKPADSLSRHLLGEYGLDRLLALWEKVAALIQMADARSLDRKHVVLGLFFAMEETLRQPDTDIS